MPLRDVPIGSIVTLMPSYAFVLGDIAYRVERPMSGQDRHWVRPMAWVDGAWHTTQLNRTSGAPFTIPSERNVAIVD